VSWAAIGLLLDAGGAFLVGLVFPRLATPVAGTGELRPKDNWGRLAGDGGWLLIVAGFLLQFASAI
jgi:hypothetical protein